ncbi:phosphatidylglycerophosphate synthase [Helicobacter baculiformis]|uniref:Phosphatidylglycerophosphate synthase n=1 Tax=Helicobacter baculiformis TaxID=427351 RepID=A0ABV7ZIB7_9HELI|nr:phosphatidylglycerophosphate synthase [Helicobacter baculiformis]
MTIFIENSPQLQSARKYILCAMALWFVLALITLISAPSWFAHAPKNLSASLKSPWMGFYLFLWLLMFVTQVVGYYKLAKVGRNLLLFRCVVLPHIAHALLSLCGLLVFKNPADMLQLKILTLDLYVYFKILILALYAYYSCRLCVELTRVTQNPLFKRGMLTIGLCFAFILFVGLAFANVPVPMYVIFVMGWLWAVVMLVGWGMIAAGFVQLKQISCP